MTWHPQCDPPLPQQQSRRLSSGCPILFQLREGRVETPSSERSTTVMSDVSLLPLTFGICRAGTGPVVARAGSQSTLLLVRRGQVGIPCGC